MKQPKRYFVKTLVLMLIITFAAPVSVSARTYTTRGAAENKINTAIKAHNSSVTFYSTSNYDTAELFRAAAYSSNKNYTKHLAEKQSFRGDYNRRSLMKGWKCDKKKLKEKGKTYYKYTYTFYYNISKAKSDYIDNKCKEVAKNYKKGTVNARVTGICTWIAKYMNPKMTQYPTLYEPLKNKEGKCTHYSLLFYKIAKEAGLEVRIIKGRSITTGHSWCIVKNGNKWYQVDPTWADAGNTINSKWIMKKSSDKAFSSSHFPDAACKKLLETHCPLAE